MCACVSQFVSERSAILLVLVIKLTKADEMECLERKGSRWRDMERDRLEREGVNTLIIV